MKALIESVKIEIVNLEFPNEAPSSVAYTDNLLSKNILLEFYETEVGNGKGMAIFAIYGDENIYQIFSLASYSGDKNPQQTIRLLEQAIKFIESCSPLTVLTDLASIATHLTRQSNEGPRRDIYDFDIERFKCTMAIIAQNQQSQCSCRLVGKAP